MEKRRISSVFSGIKQKITHFRIKTKRFAKEIYADLLIISGLTFIVYATFLLAKIAGFYALGVVLLLLGIWFTAVPPGRR